MSTSTSARPGRVRARAVLALIATLLTAAALAAITGGAPGAPPPGMGHDEEGDEGYSAPTALFSVAADGTSRAQITQAENDYAIWFDSQPNVGSDGTIVFSSTRPAGDGTTDAEIWLMRPGEEPVQLTDNTTITGEDGTVEPINDLNPVLSPDGTKVAYDSAPVVTEPEEEDGNEGGGPPDDPGSGGSGGSGGGPPTTSGLAGVQIWVLDIATKETTQITATRASDGASKQPSWSPDAAKLAYTQGDGRMSHIVAIDLATKDTVDVTPSNSHDSNPAWHPTDANLIAFTRRAGINADVYIRNLAAGTYDDLAVTDGIAETAASWSPDGSLIAYQKGDDSLGAAIWVMNADGTGQHAVTTAPSYSDRLPAFGPSAIVFESSAAAQPAADLQLAMTAQPTSPIVGSNVTYTITVYNAGPLPAPDVRVVDTLPAGLTYKSASAQLATSEHGEEEETFTPVVTVSGNAVTVQLGDLAKGERGAAVATIAIVATATTVGTFQNVAEVSLTATDDTVDPITENNRVTLDTVVQAVPSADLGVTVVAPALVYLGTDVTYTVTVTNAGPQTAVGASVVHKVPAGLTAISATASQGTTTIVGGVVTAKLGDIAAGGSAVVKIIARANAVGTQPSDIVVVAGSVDPNTGNNVVASTTTVIAAPTTPAPTGRPTPAPTPAPIPTDPLGVPPGGVSCTIVGTAGADVLVGTPGRDVMCGLGGNDRISGLGGNDLLVGGPGNDVLAGGAGTDVVNGGDGSDRVDGAAGNDFLYGGAGSDVLTHKSGHDHLYAGPGNDRLFARDRAFDWINGGLGRDVAWIDRGIDRLHSVEVVGR